MKIKRILIVAGHSLATVTLGLTAVTLGLVALSGPLAAAELASHRAIYSIGPGVFKIGGNFTGVGGSMELSLEKSCGGWTMSQTMQMNLQLANGGELRQLYRYTGRESSDGTSYDFSSSSRVGGVREDFRGRAVVDRPGGSGKAVFRVPADKKIALPQGVKFMFGHTLYLIKRAQAGDRMASAVVFDGTDDQGPQEVTAFIGRKQYAGDVIGKDSLKSLGPLVDRSGWKIRMAYYKLDSRSETPDYEVEALQLDNGVTPWMLLDYPDFSVVLKMVKLEEIPAQKC